MNSRWLFAAGTAYTGLVREFMVMNVCVDVYVSGYLNALEDCSLNKKKTLVRNFANMAGSTLSGVIKGALFPIHLPVLALQLAFKK
jgi:hypothetical protein